jgi:recombination protein RecA
MSDEKKESLKQVLDRISKAHECVVSQIKNMERPTLEVVPSGSYSIDHALGSGGYPRGRVIEVFGPESGGKTTISLIAIAEVQKAGGVAAFIDVENALSLDWAAKLGVDVENLVFNQPDSGEQALSIVRALIESNTLDMIVVDSVAALIPKQEIEGEIGDQTMALQARMLGPAIRLLVGATAKSKTVLIFINQLRDTMSMYGPKETTPGGRALRFYSSIRLAVKKVSKSEIEGPSKELLGHRVNIKVVKNKVGRPMREAEFNLRFTEGIDRLDELVTLGLTLGIIEQAGPTYSFGNVSVKGREKLLESVQADEKLQKELWKAIREYKK